VNKRLKASSVGQLLGLTPNGVSAQIVPMSNAGLCKELPREAGQDRRVSYYVITDQGKEELNRFLDQQYRLADGIYQGASMERVLKVLELIKEEVGSHIEQLLQQISP
jgi:DNA-binding MarR family transcriptional regulator